MRSDPLTPGDSTVRSRHGPGPKGAPSSLPPRRRASVRPGLLALPAIISLLVLLAPGFPAGSLVGPPASGPSAPSGASGIVGHGPFSPTDQIRPGLYDLNVTLSQTPGMASVGGVPNAIFANVTGGAGEYTIRYEGLPPGCGSQNATELICAPSGGPVVSTVSATVTDQDGDSAQSAPITFFVAPRSTLAGTLALNGTIVDNLSSMFWGVNLNFGLGSPGYANSSIAAYYNATPIQWIRFPVAGTTVIDQSLTSWPQVETFCRWVDCHSIMTVGTSNTTLDQDLAAVGAARSQYGIEPGLWVLGNEPNLWTGNRSMDGPVPYANALRNFTQAVRQSDPGAQFLGTEITGTWQGLPYIRSVSQIDGKNLSGLGVQLYPQLPVGETLVDFLNGLTSNDSVSAAVPTIRNASTAGCPSCHLPILLDEINGGTNPAYSPYRIGYPDVPFIATSVIQALGSGVAQFAPWTLTATAFRCDNGMIELQPFDCDSPTLNPLYFLYTDLFRQLPAGPVMTGGVPGIPFVSAAGFASPSGTDLLLVNSNATVAADINVTATFAGAGCVRTSELDPSHISSPTTADYPRPGSDPGGPAALTIPLAPLSVVLAIPYPTACPVGSTVSLGSDDSYVWAPAIVIAAVALTVGLVLRRRRTARRSLRAAPDGATADGSTARPPRLS
jgi:hypothetical protein